MRNSTAATRRSLDLHRRPVSGCVTVCFCVCLKLNENVCRCSYGFVLSIM